MAMNDANLVLDIAQGDVACNAPIAITTPWHAG
jgi:hypothetical protein